MCYDLSLFKPVKAIAENIDLGQPLKVLVPEDEFVPTYHQQAPGVFPKFPAIYHEDGGYKLKCFEWGLIAPYMNTPEKIAQMRNSMANAQSEKLLEPSSYWYRIRKQRCLLPCTGFFEHRDVGAKKKVPYFITQKNREIFFLPGLYNYVVNRETGELEGTFCLLTRPGNSLLRQIHNSGAHANRMPLLLTAALEKQWISPDATDDNLKKLTQFEIESAALDAWTVNSIRRPKADDISVIGKMEYPGLPALTEVMIND